MTAGIKRLWITEKRAAGLALAAGLELAFKCRNEGEDRSRYLIRMSNGDAISYLEGHMLESAPPDHYLTPEQRQGSVFAYLPLSPARLVKWPRPERSAREKAKPRRGEEPKPPAASPHLKALVSHIKAAKEIVHAGDTDREGQLIVDELLAYAGVDPDGTGKPVWRFKYDMTPEAKDIAGGLTAGLDQNNDPRWRNKRLAAEVRERGDWCMGMSASRAWREITGVPRMSAGRVQSPVVLLVVERDEKIEAFKPTEYFVPVLILADGTQMRWHKRDGAEGMQGFDTEGRIINRQVAEEIVRRVLAGSTGKFSLAECVKRSEAPPLPFDLSSLQIAAAKKFGLTLKEATDAAQSLYSNRKMISYIGTDCRYLPEAVLEQARTTVQALHAVLPQAVAGSNMDLRSPAFNDAKIDEHYGIIPTGKIASGLTATERGVFNLIARRFVAQFHPNHEYTKLSLHAQFKSASGLADEFRASEREVTRQGWRNVEEESAVDGAADHETDGPQELDLQDERAKERQ